MLRFLLGFMISFMAMPAPGTLAAAPKEYSDQELAALAAKTPEAGVIFFTGPVEGQAFKIILPSGQTAGRGFWADGRVYIDFSHPNHQDIVEKLYYRARLQGSWLIIASPASEDFSQVIVLPVSGQAPVDGGPWFWIDKTPDQDIYQVMSNWGLTNFSPGEVVLEIRPQELGGPQFRPVFGKVEDVGDVRLFTFARRDDSSAKEKTEMVYSIVYHRLRYKTLGYFERAEYGRSSARLDDRNRSGEAENKLPRWWPVFYFNDWPAALRPAKLPAWKISDTEISITPKSGPAAKLAIANPNERRSLVWFGGLFMGAFLGGRWADIDELHQTEEYRDYCPRGIESYAVYGGDGLVGFGRGGQLYDLYDGDHGSGTFYDMAAQNIEMLDGLTLNRNTAKLGLTGNWNAAPRRAIALNTKNAVYNKIVKDYLAQNGLPEAEANIMQIFKVDLEGDGIDEIFIYAQNYVKPDSQAVTWEADRPLSLGGDFPSSSLKGNYSLLLMRKVTGGKAVNMALHQNIALEDNDLGHDSWAPPAFHKIYQFADVNGDGVMEVIVGEDHYEGVSYQILEIKDGQARSVLNAGWGS